MIYSLPTLSKLQGRKYHNLKKNSISKQQPNRHATCLCSISCVIQQFLFQYCSLGRLSHEVGWKYQDVVATLETKRKVKAEVFHKKTVAVKKLRDQVKSDPKVLKRIAPYQKIIEAYGHN